MKEIKEFLEAHLSDAELERMRTLTSNWTVNPFEYFPESQTVETSDEWAWSHADLSDDDVDLLIRACELLHDALPNVPLPTHVDVGPQKITHEFIFRKGDKKLGVQVAKKFCQLLQERPGYEVAISRKKDEIIVSVSFWYRSAIEYIQQIGDIQMVLEVAQHAKDVRFGTGLELTHV